MTIERNDAQQAHITEQQARNRAKLLRVNWVRQLYYNGCQNIEEVVDRNIRRAVDVNRMQTHVYDESLRPIVTDLIRRGFGLRRLARTLNDADIPTQRGSPWCVSNVRPMLDRLGLKTKHKAPAHLEPYLYKTKEK